MKYKEMPEFETNEFKVGNHVAFYRKSGRTEGEVQCVHGDIVEIMYGETLAKSMTKVHFKQCRLLKEMNPREFYLVVDDRGRFYWGSQSLSDVRDYVHIKVREILED